MDELPMTRFLGRSIIIVGMTTLIVLEGCDAVRTKTFVIDNHIFRIPSIYLVQGAIPWLPNSQVNSLKFISNPNDRLEEQLIVTIDSSLETCHSSHLSDMGQLAAACLAAERSSEKNLPDIEFRIEKINENGDRTQWIYRLKDARGQLGNIVASCYLLSDERGGLCTALGNYENLVYSVGFRDSDIGQLAKIHKNIRSLLLTWDERTGR